MANGRPSTTASGCWQRPSAKWINPFKFRRWCLIPTTRRKAGRCKATYKINDQHSLAINGAAFVLDEVAASGRDPFMYGGQVIWNANWTPRIASSLGIGAFDIVNRNGLGMSGFLASTNNYNPGGVANINQGNTRISRQSDLQL